MEKKLEFTDSAKNQIKKITKSEEKITVNTRRIARKLLRLTNKIIFIMINP